MQEQRQTPRKNSFVGGQIMFDDPRPSLFCLVRDMSEQGARLELSEVAGVPEEFRLRVNGKAGVYRAKVIWRKDNDLGVAFQAASPAPNDCAVPKAS